MTRKDYQRHALTCIHLAAQMESLEDRVQLFAMAKAWLLLADYGFLVDLSRLRGDALLPEWRQAG